MNVNAIINLSNSDIIHEFLNHCDRTEQSIRNLLAPKTVDAIWIASHAASAIVARYRAMLLMNLDNFFSHSGPITWTSIGRRLYDVRIKTLLSITNDLHSGYMPDVIVPYTVPEWRRFYSQIWSNENVYHEIVALISADQNQLAYQLWEWLKANYPNYVKID
ncbi:hypothetical protein CSM36_24570 [Salmonella enterica subsp. enterica serovar Infantis]|nr:hypothetical protein [Salmonella enterica subsp. enterica serovar Infantis]EKP7196329.1 hypothetical protein [Salmonella enterica]